MSTSFSVNPINVSYVRRCGNCFCAIQKIVTSILDVETRGHIKVCVNLGHTQSQTFRLLQKSQVTRCYSSIVFKWHEMKDSVMNVKIKGTALDRTDLDLYGRKLKITASNFSQPQNLVWKYVLSSHRFPESWYVFLNSLNSGPSLRQMRY